MLEQPVVAITDAGQLGRSLTRLLVERGWQVAVYHVDSMRDHAAVIVDELGAGRVLTAVVDPADWDSWRAALDATRSRYGNFPQHAALICDEWRGGGPLYVGGWNDGDVYAKTTQSNLETLYRALRVFLPSMVEARHGSVVITGSRFGERPWSASGSAAYVAAKAGALALAQTAAQEVRAHDVRVNAVLLAILDEPESRAGLPGFDASRWVSPDSVAQVIAFLMSDEARDVTGALIPMYGKA